ncbi:MAG TPA: branched-chain amino acid ABC transporter permease [Candidatus Dormibacteraeota bacterium]|nr:branched-chain amino acid ABC transporter permease [Candidatus Dormibacteraeota bacterium]
MDLFVTTLIAGFVQGTINALLGAGLVAVYRGTRIINFAHGAMAMMATYIFVTLVDHKAPQVIGFPLAAMVTAVLFAIVLGVAIDLMVMRPLARQSYLVRIIATLGVLYTLQSVALLLWGGATRSVKPLFPRGGHQVGQITVSNSDLGVAVFAFGIAIGLTLFYRYSRFGTAIRAVSNSREAATLVGIRVNWVTAASWAIGGATGGIAGILLAPSLALDSYILTLLVISGLAAALTGRLESLGLALAGGIGLGVTTSLVVTYVGEWTLDHPQTWINLSHLDYAVALAWILGLLLIWKKPATTQQQAGGLLL